jgi:NAD(P)-dependent dehydrogenase (short-subunit alcohol dehydrogenase family)
MTDHEPTSTHVWLVTGTSAGFGRAIARAALDRGDAVVAPRVGRKRSSEWSSLTGMDGTQPGDPAKAAAAIIRALDARDAPLHLALGGDAVDAIRAPRLRRSADLTAWADHRDTALAVSPGTA